MEPACEKELQNENLTHHSNIAVYGICTIPITLPQIAHLSQAGGAKSSV